MLAPTPSDWMPRISAAAILPARSGSSEKYSKLRPANGLRLMLRPGPRRTLTPSAFASTPSACPTSYPRCGSHEFASVAAVGKQVAGRDWFNPRWSAEPPCLRRPCGPSVSIMEGIPRRSIPLEFQKFAPDISEAFSSRVIWPISARCVSFTAVFPSLARGRGSHTLKFRLATVGRSVGMR